MAHRNEITIGADVRYNGLVMYRKVDQKPFVPEFYFDENDNLTTSSNIEVRYIQYYKDVNGDIINKLTEHKTYIVPNRLATYQTIVVVDAAATYYETGEIITPAVLDGENNIITEAVIAVGGELKTAEISHNEEQELTPAWYAAIGWFLQLSRTPISATIGILDSIEATLLALPMDIPNGYNLQGT